MGDRRCLLSGAVPHSHRHGATGEDVLRTHEEPGCHAPTGGDGLAGRGLRGTADSWPDVALVDLSHYWVYVVGPPAGTALAVGAAYVLRCPAKSQEGKAAIGDPTATE